MGSTAGISIIQPFTSADVARISHLQPDGWNDITTIFQFYTEAPYCLPLKIEECNRIVAIGSLIMHAETAWLAHIIVEPDMRRKGLGLAITEELVAGAEKNGRHIQLLIATEMGVPLYERIGFRESCDYLFYHEPVHERLVTPLDVRPLTLADRSAIMRLDRRASGEDRGALLARYGDSGWVYSGAENMIRGYFLPRLGEGTIVAQDTEAGLALMKVRIAMARAAPVIPAGNQAAKAFLRDMGLDLRHTAARMVRHGDDPLKVDMVFNRAGGHLG